ncbi:hypothetical protein RFM68_15715 [Mesorhizobium sp. MSK_1335]|uniref:Uncharacterized protein n=1 Tax=Mesorhizobium montanum TaxID=3072323 RepID=A0ABU4ZKQ8_9HYPH|nr:hypothetical protein [Mesorhizobium sp. MSK_1335]MDX8525950.1 hypothetical protein [Mesorhizobium sp. MSK_1335]
MEARLDELDGLGCVIGSAGIALEPRCPGVPVMIFAGGCRLNSVAGSPEWRETEFQGYPKEYPLLDPDVRF